MGFNPLRKRYASCLCNCLIGNRAATLYIDTGLSGDAIRDAGLSGDAIRDTGLSGDAIRDAGLSGDVIRDAGLSGDAIRDAGLSGDVTRSCWFHKYLIQVGFHDTCNAIVLQKIFKL